MGVLSPIAKLSGWAPGPVGDMSDGARGWILWTSLAIINTHKEDYDTETEDRLVPNTWVVGGVVVSVVVGTFLPWATLLGFGLGGLLSILGVRALGETDINPVSGLGKISQLFFAWIQPGNIVANLIAGGVAEAGAQQLSLYNRAYVIPGPSFPAPTAYVWLSLARRRRPPENSGIFMISSAAIFALVSAIKTYTARRQLWYSQWIPSGVAFAMVVEYGDIRLIIVASGFVLGEGVVSVVSLVLKTSGVGVASAGMRSGLCGGCPA
ncbi:OPT oligopeptide transporter protein-domain-containing protein [Mycena leptocephala]|nr:OPT oligopeptide transporter protein-domain-containing protein [Mycena leptocephala]